MVMKQVTKGLAQSPRRLGVALAKSRFSEVLRQVANGPTIIHSRGRDLAVVLAVDEYERLTAERRSAPGGGSAFLERVEALKRQFGGGVEEWSPPPLELHPQNPFARKPRRRP